MKKLISLIICFIFSACSDNYIVTGIRPSGDTAISTNVTGQIYDINAWENGYGVNYTLVFTNHSSNPQFNIKFQIKYFYSNSWIHLIDSLNDNFGNLDSYQKETKKFSYSLPDSFSVMHAELKIYP